MALGEKPPCTCPESAMDFQFHVPDCSRYENCGGWNLDGPPCGGCDSCMIAQTFYGLTLEESAELHAQIYGETRREES